MKKPLQHVILSEAKNLMTRVRADVQRGFGCRAFNAMVRFVTFCSVRSTEAVAGMGNKAVA